MKKCILLIFLLILCFPLTNQAATDEGIPLFKAPINPNDPLSLQRGAKLFINYCSGCHSLAFMRYNRMARDMGILTANGQLDQKVLKNNLIFTGAGIAETIQIAMPPKDAKAWFGVAPPDLSLVARSRGADWLYTFLLDFYRDNSRPFGVNNLLFNETAMPDALVKLRGDQIALYRPEQIKLGGQIDSVHAIIGLRLIEPGTMTPPQFDAAVTDLVNFLVYVGEPARRDREQLGPWVIGFLVIFAILLYLLKKEYWRRIR